MTIIENSKTYEVEVGRLLLQLKTKTPTEKDVFVVDLSNIGDVQPFLRVKISYSQTSQPLAIAYGCDLEPTPALPTIPGIWTLDPKDKRKYKGSFNDEMVFTYNSESSCNIRGLEGITRRITFIEGELVNTLITAFRTPGTYKIIYII